MSKKPKIKREPIERKVPKDSPRKETKEPIAAERPKLDLTLGWNFCRMDKSGKFRCSLALLDEFTESMIRLECITIGNLLEKKHNHSINPENLSRDARARLKSLNLDAETLYQLDLKTPVRIWGFLEGNIFYILWLDPNHEVYTCKH